MGFPDTAAAFTQFLLNWLNTVAHEVSESFPDEGQIYFKDGKPILRQLPRQVSPDGAKQLRAALADRMPPINLLDILAYTEHLVNFTRHFGPLSGSDPGLADPLSTYLMTTFAYASNMGPNQTARHSHGQISASAMSRANIRHFTADKLDAAQRDIINFYIRFDLIRYWGSGKTSASDGTLINLYQNNLLSAYHLRYGDYGGIAYHHVSDTYIALFTHFISVGVWEAVYIIDGLLQNTSEIQPEMLHADTQGQSLPVFAFAHLLGIQLLPRIRNWKDLTLFRPRRDSHYEHIDELFTDVADAALIESHWQLMMQVILSIEAGVILPSTLLRRLGNYSRQNSLYRAFREVGRIVRTVFLLRLISDQAMRLQIRSVTNISESYHEFASWVSFGGQVLPTNDPLEQEKRTKYNQLLASCIILKNVIDMSALLPDLARMGYVVTPETIRTLSPYMTEHIRRFGDYVLNFDQLPDDPVSFNLHFDPPQQDDETPI
jgi:TnpA family transposase